MTFSKTEREKPGFYTTRFGRSDPSIEPMATLSMQPAFMEPEVDFRRVVTSEAIDKDVGRDEKTGTV